MTWAPDSDQYAAIREYTESVEAERDRLREGLREAADFIDRWRDDEMDAVAALMCMDVTILRVLGASGPKVGE